MNRKFLILTRLAKDDSMLSDPNKCLKPIFSFVDHSYGFCVSPPPFLDLFYLKFSQTLLFYLVAYSLFSSRVLAKELPHKFFI